VLGIPVANMTMTDALEAILARLNHDGTHQVCFVNSHCANIAWRTLAYRRVLCQATLTLVDGIGMKLAGKFLGQGFKQNVNGTDLFPRLCQGLSGANRGVFLLEANRARRKAYVTGSQSIIQRFSPVDTVTATSRLSRSQTSSATSPSLVQTYSW
jgi:UDP-N-acetyl-D-mannosaminuronic acid transferase (WecB/TagA/CpsF family)